MFSEQAILWSVEDVCSTAWPSDWQSYLQGKLQGNITGPTFSNEKCSWYNLCKDSCPLIGWITFIILTI